MREPGGLGGGWPWWCWVLGVIAGALTIVGFGWLLITPVYAGDIMCRLIEMPGGLAAQADAVLGPAAAASVFRELEGPRPLNPTGAFVFMGPAWVVIMWARGQYLCGTTPPYALRAYEAAERRAIGVRL